MTERDHFVYRYKLIGVSLAELLFYFFALQEFSVGNLVPHFRKVQQCELCHGIAIWFAGALIFCKYRLPVVAMLVHEREQHGAILEAGIHTLAVKWHNGMRSIA